MDPDSERPLYSKPLENVLSSLQTSKQGLSTAEAAHRLSVYGPNVLIPKRKAWWRSVIEPFASLFVSVLLVAAIVSLLTHEVVDALVITVVLVINAVIYYVQQFSVSNALKSLRKKDVAQLKVRRGGQIMEISSEAIVPGDIVFLAEGVKVPADGRLIECENLRIDESMLTGESLPVTKTADVLQGTKQVYDQTDMAFKGTLVHGGTGMLAVMAIGNSTELGKISLLASTTDTTRTPIEHKIDRLTKQLVIVVAIVGSVVFGLALMRGITTAEALRFTLSLIVSVVPEGLPVALTVVLLLNAKKMAKVNALVRQISGIETMGSITLIATDKTGTLTKNELSVAGKASQGLTSQQFAQVVAASLNGEKNLRADPIDSILAEHFSEEMPAGWLKVREYSFNQALRLSAVLWQTGGKQMLYVKGAPEAILGLSSRGTASEAMQDQLTNFTAKGYRTLAVAHKELTTVPKELHESVLANLSLDGLIGLADEIRPGIVESVEEAHNAGIKVIMLTGDHMDTAAEVGRKIKLVVHSDQVFTSEALEENRLPLLGNIIDRVRVFSRVLPQHKFNFLRELKGKEITAMTGDGVNDIPALLEADVGLAMGSGTDAAKDASDIILLDNNFNTIVAAVRLGRAVVANIQKMLFYVISTSIGEVMTMIGALLVGLPLPVTAVQVLWINIVTDTFSVLPLGMSGPENHQMHELPRDPKAPLLDRVYVSRMIVTGLSMAVFSLILFWQAQPHGKLYAQTVVFVALVVAQLANALNANFHYHSWVYNFIRPNKALFIGIGLAILFQAVAMYGPLASAFGTVKLESRDLLVAIMMPFVGVLIVGDLHKFIFRRSR